MMAISFDIAQSENLLIGQARTALVKAIKTKLVFEADTILDEMALDMARKLWKHLQVDRNHSYDNVRIHVVLDGLNKEIFCNGE